MTALVPFDTDQLCVTFEQRVAEIAPEATFRCEIPAENDALTATAIDDITRTVRRVAGELDVSIGFIGTENAGRISTPVQVLGVRCQRIPNTTWVSSGTRGRDSAPAKRHGKTKSRRSLNTQTSRRTRRSCSLPRSTVTCCHTRGIPAIRRLQGARRSHRQSPPCRPAARSANPSSR